MIVIEYWSDLGSPHLLILDKTGAGCELVG